jgi:general secretion pathway protein N
VPLGEQRAGIHEKAQGLKIDLYSAPNAELGITGTVQLNLKTRPPAVDARISLQPRVHADLAITQFLENNPDRDDQGRYLWTTGPAPSKAQIAR